MAGARSSASRPAWPNNPVWRVITSRFRCRACCARITFGRPQDAGADAHQPTQLPVCASSFEQGRARRGRKKSLRSTGHRPPHHSDWASSSNGLAGRAAWSPRCRCWRFSSHRFDALERHHFHGTSEQAPRLLSDQQGRAPMSSRGVETSTRVAASAGASRISRVIRLAGLLAGCNRH